MRVTGQSILVTGAGNGIGEGIAKRLAEQGAYATKQLRQRRTYEFYPWNPVTATPEPKVPRSSQPRDRLKLARYYQSLLDSGKFECRAALSRFLGVSRARVTQVLNRLRDEQNTKVG